jgi:hypothetical protein
MVFPALSYQEEFNMKALIYKPCLLHVVGLAVVCISCFVGAAHTYAQQSLTTATDNTVYPPDFGDWPKASPEQFGWSSQKLAEARAEMTDDQGNTFTIMDAIVLVDGHDIYHYDEAYSMRPGLAYQQDWASCGRSIMTTMYGMAFKEHGESVDALNEPARICFNNFHARTLDERVLVKHLLGYATKCDPPGTQWHYHCSYFDLYRCLREIDGVPVRYRLAKLSRQIGALWEPYEYWGHGEDVPFLTFKATSAQAARWGYLWLQRGNWKGVQIVDPAFVDASVMPLRLPDNSDWLHSGEGLQIHLNFGGMWGDLVPRDAYAAFGAGGKIIVVIPSLRLVYAASMTPVPYTKQMRDGLQVRDIRGILEPLLAAAPSQVVSPPTNTNR